MSDMVERAARAMWEVRREKAGLVSVELEEWGDGSIPRANHIMEEARAAIAIVIEDCALVAESESIDGCEWIVAKIAARIRSAPEDSAAQSEIEKLAAQI